MIVRDSHPAGPINRETGKPPRVDACSTWWVGSVMPIRLRTRHQTRPDASSRYADCDRCFQNSRIRGSHAAGALYFRQMAHVDVAVRDPGLRPVAEKVLAGQPLGFEDGLTLHRSRDLHAIGRLANFVRQKLHGNKTYYNRNRHINYTNVCALSCKFCSFYRKRGEEGAYEMPVEQVIAIARKAADAGATEVHIVGGLHPWLKFDYYLDMLRGIRRECPDLHIKAFTAIEIVHFSRIARTSVHDVLAALREAGLGSMPGGGAEIFDDRVHDEAFKGKVRADKWFEVHRTAHSLGISTNATMLYGHGEEPEERIGHLMQLRELKAESLAAMWQGSGFGVQCSGLRVQGSGDECGDPSFLNPQPRTLIPRAGFN